MNVSLTPDLERFTRRLVESGRYGSPSDVVRSSLQLLEKQEAEAERLRQQVQEGLDSGPATHASRDDLKALARERMAQLRAEVERGERPAPGGPGSATV